MTSDSARANSVLDRLCSLDAAQWGRLNADDSQGLRIADHLDGYLQIERDNPRIIWLYSLILEERVVLPDGEIVASMKQRLLDEPKLTPIAWRYLANGTARDFRVVLDARDPEGGSQWRWHTLVAWLQVLTGLRRRRPISEPVQGLLLHDGLVVEPESKVVLFRGAWMRFEVFGRILDEAETRCLSGTLAHFAESELGDVITWMACVQPAIDNNQMKEGWSFLARAATEWKADNLAMAEYSGLKWVSALPTTYITPWKVEPITDAWSMRQLAISQRHCADRFIESCQNGSDRIFLICGPEGTLVATLRITCIKGTWIVGDLRGFANSDVPTSISDLGDEIARRYGEFTKGKEGQQHEPRHNR